MCKEMSLYTKKKDLVRITESVSLEKASKVTEPSC